MQCLFKKLVTIMTMSLGTINKQTVSMHTNSNYKLKKLTLQFGSCVSSTRRSAGKGSLTKTSSSGGAEALAQIDSFLDE